MTANVEKKILPNAQLAQLPGRVCSAMPSSGDGTAQLCMVMMMCPPGTTEAVMNGCTSCVDPGTCLASNGH